MVIQPHGPRARLGARFLTAVALIACLCALLLPRIAGLVGAHWGEANAAYVRAHHERTFPLAPEAFVHDWSNEVSGQVVGPDGSAIAGASIEIFTKSDLLQAVAAAAEPAPEARVTTDGKGRFVAPDLSYGCKYVRARAAGYREHVLEDVVSLDGTGAQDLNLALEEAAEWTVTLRQDDESVVAGEALRIVPEGLIERSLPATADERGRVALPPHLRGQPGSGVWLLVGEPSTTLRVTRDDDMMLVPPAVPLSLQVVGATPGPALVRLLPAASPRLGSHAVTLDVENGAVVIPGVRPGSYGIAVQQGDRAGWIEVEHDGTPHECILQERWSTRVSVVDRLGQALQVPVQWRWQPSKPVYPSNAAADRRSLLDQADPLVREGVALQGGAFELSALLPTSGWLELNSVEHGRSLAQLELGRAEHVVPLQAEVVTVITHLPFLPIHVETSDGWTATYEANRFGEVRTLLPAGPYLVRSRFNHGRVSRPWGGWAGWEADPIAFSIADAVDEVPRVTFAGFVRSRGEPVAGVEVHAFGKRGSMKVTTDHGFYRFDDMSALRVRLSVREADNDDAILWPTFVDVDPDTREARVDLELWHGTLELRALPPTLEGELIALCTRDLEADRATAIEASYPPSSAGVTVRRSSTVVDGAVKFAGLRPGDYEIWHEDSARVERMLHSFVIGDGEQRVIEGDEL